jgi:opacity protein-like surface antigen
MRSVKNFAIAGAALLLSYTAASAADMPPMPPPIYKAPVAEFGGWYLRGDIGMTNQKVKSIENTSFIGAQNFGWFEDPSFGSSMLFGLGVGYKYNSWLRFDATGEYRSKAQFHALDHYTQGVQNFTNDYTAKKSEWLAMANVYVDLGTWWHITPFIGAGVGAVNINIDNFRDNNIIAGGGAFAATGSKWNFAWAVHAGLAYEVTRNFTVELAYRYLDLGDAVSGDLVNFDGSNLTNNPMTFKNVTSHDVKLGVRWMLAPSEPMYAPPLMRKG